MTDYSFDTLVHICNSMGIELTKRQICQFCEYFELLTEWNTKINLTAITALDEVQIKHFADSLTIVNTGIDIENKSIADIGTGAGFPGIPIKIVFPSTKVVLMDSLDKRVKFLNLVINQLELHNITAVHGRVEDLAHMEEYREKFDIVVSRAVARMSVLSEYCIPFAKKKGVFIAYKSDKAEDEIREADKAFKSLKSSIQKCNEFTIEGTDIYRNIVVVKKMDETDKRYPRKAGTPSKNPIT